MFTTIAGKGAVAVLGLSSLVGGMAAGLAPAANAAAPSAATCTVVTIHKGSTGALVKTLQQRLGGLSADGVFGNLTLAKVKAFQKSHGLSVDGIVGPKTWAALGGFPCTNGGGGSTDDHGIELVEDASFGHLGSVSGPGVLKSPDAKLHRIGTARAPPIRVFAGPRSCLINDVIVGQLAQGDTRVADRHDDELARPAERRVSRRPLTV